MSASEAAVTAAMDELGCKVKWPGKPWATCRVEHHSLENWTDRGCPIAVAVADAVAVIAARDALEAYAADLVRRADAMAPEDDWGESIGDTVVSDAYRFVAAGIRSRAKGDL